MSDELTWRERQKRQLHDQIYRESIALFELHGYEQTTVQQITDRVRVAKGTFFNHFPSKEHVVLEWYTQITRSCLSAASARVELGPEAAICALFTDMTSTATASPELLIAKSRNSADPILMAAEVEQVDAMNRYLLAQCKNAKKTGDLGPSVDPVFFVGVLGAVLTGTSRAWVLSDPRFDFPGMICDRVRFLFSAARDL